MDSLAIRAARARRIASLLPTLVARGGDELAVLESELDGLLDGLETHGRMDLDAPRDWVREQDQELRDWAVYRACRREADRRALERRAALAPFIDDEATEVTPPMIAARDDEVSDGTPELIEAPEPPPPTVQYGRRLR